ncbi:MAG: hypothetical protein M3167_06270 [Acidobacteriota bacterium]|nr:hypothetical protein [Acidobacteriota bacterium]MDQ6892269.1 hypothetical protein [Acidobacteriota bacterium]
MKKILRAVALALSLLVAVPALTFSTGCGSATAIQTEYRTLGSVVELRDLAMKAWASYYVQQTPPGTAPSPDLAAKAARVRDADEKYRAALKVFRGAVSVAYSDKTTAPPEVAAAASSLVDLIRSFGVKV